MSKSSRIAALDEKIEGLHAHLASLAAEHDGEIAMLRAHCGIPRPDAPPADPAPASATLAVGDTVEMLDRARLADDTICAASPAPGTFGTIEAITTDVDGKPYKVRFSTGSPDYWHYPASSLRRVQPAPDVQPAAEYFAGQAVECDSISGKVTGQFVCELDPGFYAVLIGNSPIDHRYRAAEIRPCPASAGCVVMDRQSGEYGLVHRQIEGDELWVQSGPDEWMFDPARHAVMLVPRQPAAPAEQPTPPAYCPECHHALGQADKHGCKCAAPAEQPAPLKGATHEQR